MQQTWVDLTPPKVELLKIFIPSGSFSAEKLSSMDYYTDPQAITERITTTSASNVVYELNIDKKKWYYVLHNIAKGSRDWLIIATALRAGTDAGTSCELKDTINSALIKAPENVLIITLQTFKIWEICGRSDPLPTFEKAIEDLENQISAVHSVENPQLLKRCNACLKELVNTRFHLYRFFEIEEHQ